MHHTIRSQFSSNKSGAYAGLSIAERVRRSSASPSPAPQTKLRLSGPFCYTHQCFICGILQRGITELFLVIVTDFLNNCYIIKIRKCKSHGYLINSYLAFCFLLFSMTTLLQLGVHHCRFPSHITVPNYLFISTAMIFSPARVFGFPSKHESSSTLRVILKSVAPVWTSLSVWIQSRNDSKTQKGITFLCSPRFQKRPPFEFPEIS